MTNTTMLTGAGHGATNVTALKADVAAGAVNLPAGTYDLDDCNFPSGSTINITWAAGAKLRPAKSLTAPLLSATNSTWTLTNPAGNAQFDCRTIAEICVKATGGTFNATNYNVTGLGRPTYSVQGTYGLSLSGVTGVSVIAGIKVRNIYALPDGTLGNQSGLARAFGTFNCDNVTFTGLDLAGMLDSDDGDYFQIQDNRAAGSQGTIVIDGGTIEVNEKTRRWGKQFGCIATVKNLTISRKAGFVAYDGTTMIGEKNLQGYDFVDPSVGSCWLENIVDDCKAFKISACKSASGVAPITVKNCTFTGTTMNAHNSFINSDGTTAPTIGVWNAGGTGAATYIGTAPSGYDTAKSGTWV